MSKILVSFLLAVSFLYSFSTVSEAQVPNGVTDRVSSQLLYAYDQDGTAAGGGASGNGSVGADGTTNERNSWVQVSNTSATEQVWIHVQILRSSGPLNVCEESDFVDLLTPRDTHMYNLQQIRRNEAGAAVLPADPGIDNAVEDTKGFVFITPIVGQNDRRAISFQQLIGNVVILDNARDFAYGVNAYGRDAVNLATGAILPNGNMLDGVGTGFQTILPSQFSFEIASQDDPSVADVVIISFDDTYGAGPFDGYEPVAGSSTIDPFIVGADEDAISCTDFVLGCYHDLGINNAGLPYANGLINANGVTPPFNLCGGEDPFDIIVSPEFTQVGWVFTPVLTASQNVISFFGHMLSATEFEGGAVWTRAE
ncbi:MAG: hypothetical protein ACR2NW_02620 [Thermodesulfobacteriota bacterium]